MTQPPNSPPPAGWYADPTSGAQRYWDGSAWGPFAPPPAGAPVAVTIVNPPKRRNLLGTLSFFCALLAVLLSYSVPAAAGALSMFTGVGAIVALFLPRRRRPMAAWALVLSLLAFLLAATYTTMTLAS